eukprot:scaffold111278_cov34-Tisochrysis_lutea.AAC.4
MDARKWGDKLPVSKQQHMDMEMEMETSGQDIHLPSHHIKGLLPTLPTHYTPPYSDPQPILGT